MFCINEEPPWKETYALIYSIDKQTVRVAPIHETSKRILLAEISLSHTHTLKPLHPPAGLDHLDTPGNSRTVRLKTKNGSLIGDLHLRRLGRKVQWHRYRGDIDRIWLEFPYKADLT